MADCNVKCPFCGTEYEMDVNLIGQEFECQNCKENFYAESDVPVEEMQQKESYFNVSCPHCGGMCEIDQNSVGQEVACPYCNKGFNVPPVQENSSPDERIASQQPEKRGPSEITRSPKLTIPSLMQSAKKNTAAGFGKFSLKIDPLKNSSSENESEPDTDESAELAALVAQATASARSETDTDESAELEENIAEHRRALAKFFATAEAVKSTWGLIGNILTNYLDFIIFPIFLIKWIFKLFSSPSGNILSRYKFIQHIDQTKLEKLNILERYGKHIDQLVASPQTLFSPAIDYGSSENNDGSKFHYAIYSDQKNFIYSLEEVTKLYTFEDQLFVFKAYWDYTTGELFSESSEAFFFKDITDISTQSSYERVWKKLFNPKREKVKKRLKQILCVSILLIIIIGVLAFVLIASKTLEPSDDLGIVFSIIQAVPSVVFLISLLLFLFYSSPEKTLCRVKRSETFVITASSGNHIGMSILCDEWIAAKEGNITKRSNGDQIIQSIRKMIEEKKVAADA